MPDSTGLDQLFAQFAHFAPSLLARPMSFKLWPWPQKEDTMTCGELLAEFQHCLRTREKKAECVLVQERLSECMDAFDKTK